MANTALDHRRKPKVVARSAIRSPSVNVYGRKLHAQRSENAFLHTFERIPARRSKLGSEGRPENRGCPVELGTPEV